MALGGYVYHVFNRVNGRLWIFILRENNRGKPMSLPLPLTSVFVTCSSFLLFEGFAFSNSLRLSFPAVPNRRVARARPGR